MKKTIRLTRLSTFVFFITLFISLTILSGTWILIDYKGYRDDLVDIELRSVESYKSYVMHEVNTAIDYAEYKRSQILERARDDLRRRVDECITIARNVYESLADTTDKQQIEDAVRHALRPIRFFDGQGYYFALSMNGVQQLYPILPDLEGVYMNNLKDSTGEFAIQQEIQLIRNNGEGFITSYWNRPGDEEKSKRLSYIRYFGPFDWYFGTGVYLDDMEQVIRNEVLSRLSRIRLLNDGYIFVGQYDGLSLLGPNTGQNMFDYADDRGVKVVQELISLASDGGGFLMYQPPKNVDFTYTTKVSYVQGFDEWEWYVGGGIQIEDIELAIIDRRLELRKDVWAKLSVLGAVYLSVIGTTLILWSFLSRRLQRSVRVFSDFFERAANTHQKIDLDRLTFHEARNLAVHANYMVDEYLQNRRDLIEKENEISRAERLESLGVLAGGIAHDFNNLLAVILGNISLIKTTPEIDPETLESLDDAEHAVLLAQGLATQLLTFSRGGAPAKEVVVLGTLLKQSVEFALKGSQVIPEFEIDNDLHTIEVDPGQFSQMINNLIINAQQAMPDGGVVTICARNGRCRFDDLNRVRDSISITVSDNGPGINPDDLEHIFEPYFTTKNSGSGLGLATVHSIITKHGGTISVRSTSGGGARFSICLPASSVAIAELTENRNSLEVTAIDRVERVLLMDDEPKVRATATKMLQKLGIDVVATSNGEDAIVAFTRAIECNVRFDLVLLDLTIRGGMGGLECLKTLREIDPLVRAVVTSGYSKDQVLSLPGDYGFEAALRKPFRIEDLQQALGI